MRPSPVWQALFADGAVVKAGVLRGRIVVWGSDNRREAELNGWIGQRHDYSWPEGLVFNTGSLWALPYTMQTVFPDATVTLVDGVADPLPARVASAAPIPGEPASRFRHLKAVPST